MSTERRGGGWLPGEVVRDHALMQRLGRGGMGEVWRARHIPTGAVRAIKVLPVVEDAETLVRFQREGEAMARVGGHPNLVQVHTSGVHAGRPWLAMELIEGGDLVTRLEAGALPPEQAARLVRDVARAVAHVHAHGVIHRDIKPANVLMQGDVPRLTDFGLARIAGEKSLTATGTILGTPSHMAPEQARGERVDERCDVYGLGALLHQALTRNPPVRGQTTIEVLSRVIAGELDPPPPGLPPGLLELRRRALAYEPEQRFPGAAAMADALDAWLAGDAPARAPALRGWWAPLLVSGSVIGLAVVLRQALQPGPPAPDRVGDAEQAPGPGPDSAAIRPAPASPWPARFRERLVRSDRPDETRGGRVRALNLTHRYSVKDMPAASLLAQARPLAEEGHAPAERLVGELLLAREHVTPELRQEAHELLWRGSRPPREDEHAGVLLATDLLRTGDAEGARWFVAEAAWRATEPAKPGPLTLEGVCRISVQLGTPGDLGRAIRLARVHPDELRQWVEKTRPSPEAGWLLALLQAEDADSSATLDASLLTHMPPHLAGQTRLFLARSPNAALRELADDPSLAGAALPRDWLSAQPLTAEWSEADRFFRERPAPAGGSDWAARLRAGPAPERRPVDSRRLELRQELVALVQSVSKARPLEHIRPRLEEMAREGFAEAQAYLGEKDPERTDARELLWTGSREPHPEPKGGVILARRLWEAGDVDGARWLTAEAALRAANSEDALLAAAAIGLSLRLGEPSDVARALRLLRQHAGLLIQHELSSLRPSLAGLLQAICRLEGWGGSSAALEDEQTVRDAQADPELAGAIRTWLARGGNPSLAARFGVTPVQEPLDERSEADQHFRVSPWVERFRLGPAPRRHVGWPEQNLHESHLTGLRGLLDVPERRQRALSELRDLAETGECARAEGALAELEPGRERRAELLWRASRDPAPDRWAGLRLADLVREGGDEDGARWLIAEACARAHDSRDVNFVAAAAGGSLRLGGGADVERALALLKRRAEAVFSPSVWQTRQFGAELERAICQAEGWGGSRTIDEPAIRAALADPVWGQAARGWLSASPLGERFGVPRQDVIPAVHPADDHFRRHPPDPSE